MLTLAALSDALSGAPLIAAPAAVAWGLASIWLSPCHLAGVPLVVAWLAATPEPATVPATGTATAPIGATGAGSGAGFGAGSGARSGAPTHASRRRALIILAFALGSLLSLLPLGGAALLLGRLAGDLGFSGNYLAAVLCILAGLYLLDWLPLPTLGRGLPQPARRGPGTALLLGLIFGLALGPCAFAWIAPVLGVAALTIAGQGAGGGLLLALVLLVLFAVGHLVGVLLAASSLGLVQRWLDAMGRHRGLALGRAACGVLLLVVAGVLIDSA